MYSLSVEEEEVVDDDAAENMEEDEEERQWRSDNGEDGIEGKRPKLFNLTLIS